MWGSDSPFYSYAAEINHEVVKLISTYEREMTALKSNPAEVVQRITATNTLKYLGLTHEDLLA
jgi:hypothetical protein